VVETGRPDVKVPSDEACGDLGNQLGPAVEISNGTSPLVDAYFVGDKVIVVAHDRIELVTRFGLRLELVRWEAGNGGHAWGKLDSAAFDGSILVITAGQWLVTYDTELNELMRVYTSTPCTSGVLVSNHRFVCGDPGEYDRKYYVYDALTGELLVQTQPNFEKGSMGSIPGRDAFLNVSGSFTIYEVDSANGIAQAAGSAMQDEATLHPSPIYAFTEDPALHLVTESGFLASALSLRLESDLAHLPENTRFAAMDVDAAGKLHAIVQPLTPNALSSTISCEGCKAERIDVATGTVEASVTFTVSSSQLQALRVDPQGGVLMSCGYGDYNDRRVMLLRDAP
jgi:hypothetical protein